MTPEEIEFLQESNYIEGEDGNIDCPGDAWKYIATKKKLTTRHIEIAHKILMRDKPYPPPRGWFRDVPAINVRIGNRACPDYGQVRKLMEKWVKQRHKLGWQQAHIEFESIHPFADGNGRIGRILLNYQRLEEGLPILVIRADERLDYYAWFSAGH